MKTYLRDKQSFIAVSPVPKHNVPDGLTVELGNGVQMQCDIVEGVMRYDVPEQFRGKVVKVFING